MLPLDFYLESYLRALRVPGSSYRRWHFQHARHTRSVLRSGLQARGPERLGLFHRWKGGYVCPRCERNPEKARVTPGRERSVRGAQPQACGLLDQCKLCPEPTEGARVGASPPCLHVSHPVPRSCPGPGEPGSEVSVFSMHTQNRDSRG